MISTYHHHANILYSVVICWCKYDLHGLRSLHTEVTDSVKGSHFQITAEYKGLLYL